MSFDSNTVAGAAPDLSLVATYRLPVPASLRTQSPIGFAKVGKEIGGVKGHGSKVTSQSSRLGGQSADGRDAWKLHCYANQSVWFTRRNRKSVQFCSK